MKNFKASLEELNYIVEYIVQELPKGCVIILQGDLASGKTTLTKAFVKYFNITQEVTSPTFSIQQCYGENIFHYDIYNDGVDKFLELGLLEELENEGYHLIEWGDEKLITILSHAEIPTLVVEISKVDEKRAYKVSHA